MKKTKIKPILPSLKEKKRYVMFKVLAKSNISQKLLTEAIINSYKNSFGEIGLAHAGIQFVDFDQHTQTGLLRITNKHVDSARYAFAMIKEIDGEEVVLFTKGISGTIKKAKIKFMDKIMNKKVN